MLACKEFLQENDVVDYLRSDFLHSAQVAIGDKSVFRVALSGGKTPVPFFQSMAKTAARLGTKNVGAGYGGHFRAVQGFRYLGAAPCA